MPYFTSDRRKNRDRRGADRSEVQGVVEISFSVPVAVTITATLIEHSATGFRAAYDAKSLEPGLDVAFRHDGTRGQARVMWTHVLEGRRVSGFLVLSPQSR